MAGGRKTLEQRLGVSFADGSLLVQALSHPSVVNEDPQAFPFSNQRLEFLGDAFLGFVVAHELYHRLSLIPEGQLTELRSAIVRGETLARVARGIGLGAFIHLGQGEEAGGGRDRESILAAALEAVVGALLLDQGHEVASRLTLKLLEPELERAVQEGIDRDPKSRLQEVAQGLGKGSPVYRTVGESGPPHDRVFAVEAVVGGQVLGRGSGHRKIEGERAAALKALETLQDTIGEQVYEP